MTRVGPAVLVEACGMGCPHYLVSETAWDMDRCGVGRYFGVREKVVFGKEFPEWCPLGEAKHLKWLFER